MWLALESAGREDSGDELVLTADGGAVRRQRHLGFGAGIHRCPAFHLAHTELTIFLNEWLKRITEFEIEPGFTPAIVCQGATKPDRLPLVWKTT
ncbi:hypothetical protein [Mycobacterium sp. Aquia_213]|uniref:hypothetical protein n=1 Tax=Mycobacterium sp. Aquia_213 TaxID=2991728 RepID=UPI00226E55E8|nr:hypothetical protein [Mycobacterium sp. Aquia_213]WAC89713.1 hypothetical protein LMQ14_17345 [Mycobacterium sp. Aquia_213]